MNVRTAGRRLPKDQRSIEPPIQIFDPAKLGKQTSCCPACSQPVPVSLQPHLSQMVAAFASGLSARKAATPVSWFAFEEEIEAMFGVAVNEVKTWKAHKRMFDIVREVADTPNDISEKTVAELIKRFRKDGNGNQTIRGKLAILRAHVNYALSKGYLVESPFVRGRWRLPVAPRKDRHLTLAQLVAVLDQADVEWKASHPVLSPKDRRRTARLRALVYLASFLGARASEALWLQWGDFDFAASTVQIGEHLPRTKTIASRATIVLPRAAAEVLLEWRREAPAGNPWVIPAWRRADKPWHSGKAPYRPVDAVKALGGRAGVPIALTVKMLRHTWATHARSKWGLSKEQVRQQLRHTNNETQENYCHPDLDNLRALLVDRDFRRDLQALRRPESDSGTETK